MTAAEAGEEPTPLPGPVVYKTFMIHWINDANPSVYHHIVGSAWIEGQRMLALIRESGEELWINIDEVSEILVEEEPL